MGENQDAELQPQGTPGTPSPQSCCWRSHFKGGRDSPSSSEVEFGEAKEHKQSYISLVSPREVQVSDHCKQINALKGTAENIVSDQQHLMSQDAVGSSHQ